MRDLKDKQGVTVSIAKISGTDSFAGMIEATPRIIRRWRLRKAQEKMQENPGVFYWGLEQLEQDIKNADDFDDWPAREVWNATVKTRKFLGAVDDMYHYENKQLDIFWYQEGGDPMEMLRLIISSIDFSALCITEVAKEYDCFMD